MRSETTPTTSYETGGAAGDLRTPADPTRMTASLTGTDLNLTPLSKTLRKAGYRGVGQVEPVLPQSAVDSTPNFGNRPPLQLRPTTVQIALKTLEGLLRHCGDLALRIRIDLHTHRHAGSRSLMNRSVRMTPSGRLSDVTPRDRRPIRTTRWLRPRRTNTLRDRLPRVEPHRHGRDDAPIDRTTVNRSGHIFSFLTKYQNTRHQTFRGALSTNRLAVL